MSAAPLVMMLAGGTGCHVYPALAVAEELRERGYRVEWVGTRRGLEARVVPAAGIALHCLAVRGLRGKSPLDTLRGVLALAVACGQALALLLRPVRAGTADVAIVASATLRAHGFAAVVSGAGPSVLVLADGPGQRLEAAEVAASVTDTPWEPRMLAVDVKGGTVRNHTEGATA